MVLLLLALGSLLLKGLTSSSARCWRKPPAKRRRSAIRLERIPRCSGKNSGWTVQDANACRDSAAEGWRACLRIFDDASVLLIASGGRICCGSPAY
jgi:hypothetical protein